MLTLLLASVVSLGTALTAPQAQPIALDTTVIEYRIVDATSAIGYYTSDAPANAATPYSPSSVTVKLTVGGGAEQAGVALSSLAAFQKRDVRDSVSGSAQSLTLKFYVPNRALPIAQTTLSTNSIARQTVTFAFTSAPSAQNTCQPATSGLLVASQSFSSCTSTSTAVLVPGFTATAVTETFQAYDCDTIALSLSQGSACGVRVKRVGAAVANGGVTVNSIGEAVYLDKLFTSENSLTLSRGYSWVVEAKGASYSGADAATLLGAREFRLVVSGDATPAFSDAVLQTGFVKIVNAAHRETPNTALAGQPSNSVADSSDVAFEVTTPQGSSLLHYVDNLASAQQSPSGSSSFFELPFGTYSVKVYAGQRSRQQLYGTTVTPVNTDVSVATTSVTVGAAARYQLVVLRTGSAPFSSGIAAPFVVDVSPPTVADKGTTYVVHNELTGAASSVKLLVRSGNQDEEHCNVVTGSAALTSQNKFTFNTLSDAPFSVAGCGESKRTLEIVDGASSCKSANKVSTAGLVLQDGAACSIQHVFLLGRSAKYVTLNTPSLPCTVAQSCVANQLIVGSQSCSGGTSGTPPTCSCSAIVGSSAQTTCQQTFDFVGGLDFVGGDPNALGSKPSSELQTLVVDVPLCGAQCPANVVTPICTDPCDALINGKVDNVLTAVASRATSGDIKNDGDKTRSDLSKVTKTVNKIAKKVKDINNIKDDVDNIKGDVNDIKDDNKGGLADDLKQIDNNVKDIKKKVAA